MKEQAPDRGRIDTARHRLEVLYADSTSTQGRPWITPEEREALRVVLDELHRLHLAVSNQRKTLQAIADARNKARRKPAGARSPRPTTTRPKEKT